MVIIDEKLSSINQCQSIVNELKKKTNKKILIKYITIKLNFMRYLPNFFIYYFILIRSLFSVSKIKKNFDFILSCGRISAPFNLFYKKKNNCKSCHILNPYFGYDKFDFIIVPDFDEGKFVKKKNLITTFGTLVDKSKLLKKKDNKLKFINIDKFKKIISVLVGGSGRSSKIEFSEIKSHIDTLNNFTNKYQVIYCFSRRTPYYLKKNIKKLANKSNFFFPKNSYNPYWDVLKISDYILVTSDSISMISDSLSTGKPTYIIPIKKTKKKIFNFKETLIESGKARIFHKKLESWNYTKLSEVERVCRKLSKSLNL